METPSSARIREVGPRDGFQSWPDFIPTERKVEVIEAISKAGVQEMEVTSFVSPKAIPQLRDAADLVPLIPRDGFVRATLVPNLKGAEKAL